MLPGMMCAGVASVGISPVNVTDQSISNSPSASYRLKNGGTVETNNGGSFAFVETWTEGNPADFDAMMTEVSGTILGSGSWLNLGTTRTFTASSATGTIAIRPAGGGATLDSATIDFSS